MTAAAPDTSADVAAIRAFNRFYTARIGALRDGLLATAHPLPEARVLYELGQRDATDVGDLRPTLGPDARYLSRPLPAARPPPRLPPPPARAARGGGPRPPRAIASRPPPAGRRAQRRRPRRLRHARPALGRRGRDRPRRPASHPPR